jgi:hypothetical protein
MALGLLAAWLDDAEPRIASFQPRVRLQALKVSGLIAFHILADTERADGNWTDGLAVAEELGETEDIAWLEHRRAGAAWERGELQLALAHWETRLFRPGNAQTPPPSPTRSTCLARSSVTSSDSTRRSGRSLMRTQSSARAARRSGVATRSAWPGSSTHQLGEPARH